MLDQGSFWHGLSVGMKAGSGSHVPARSWGLTRHRGGPCFAASAPNKGNFASSLGARRNACWAVADSWCHCLVGLFDHTYSAALTTKSPLRKEIELTPALFYANILRSLFLKSISLFFFLSIVHIGKSNCISWRELLCASRQCKLTFLVAGPDSAWIHTDFLRERVQEKSQHLLQESNHCQLFQVVNAGFSRVQNVHEV